MEGTTSSCLYNKKEFNINNKSFIAVVCMLMSLSGLCADKTGKVTPEQYLKSLPKPVFKKNNSLLPLSRWGWTLSFETRVELTENWGYGLAIGNYLTDAVVKRLTDPKSVESKIAALSASDPEKYPLVVVCSRQMPPDKDLPPSTWTRDKKGNLLNAQAKSQDGTEWKPGISAVYSPEAPDSVWQECGKLRADPIAELRKKCPIAIILNGGEYGLGIPGFSKKIWEKDPAVIKAKGDRSWFEYISEKKANEELIIADAVRKAAPDRKLYIYYPTDGGFHRDEYPGWEKWYYGYRWMAPVSDLPNGYAYYMQFNTGWTGPRDLLTQALDAKGYEIKSGHPLSYNWLCAGWDQKNLGDEEFSDIGLYTGFLKCYYTAGMVGGVAGYFSYPKGGFNAAFDINTPPHWLKQITALSRVHALFTHFDDFLRNSTLLPGPNRHPWAKDQPAYLFPPSGEKNSSQLKNLFFYYVLKEDKSEKIKIIARKHNKLKRWLITAWATDGKTQEVKTFIPEVGHIKLTARPDGSVYTAEFVNGKLNLTLIDANGLFPTKSL